MRTIKQFEEEDRPREKLLKRGANTLSNQELLAIFIRTGVKGKNAIEFSRELIQTYGLRGLLNLHVDNMSKIHGLGRAKIAQLKAVMELAQRFLSAEAKHRVGDQVTQSKIIIKKLNLLFSDKKEEVFVVVFMDNQHQIICIEELFQGSINQAHVYPRVILRKALEYNAAAIILSHNHPSELCSPSAEDKHLTERIKQAMKYIDVRVLDHIIIAGSRHYSFSEQGCL